MSRRSQYPQELRERAVRMVAEIAPQHESEFAAMRAVAQKHRRLFGEGTDLPPTELEEAHYRHRTGLTRPATQPVESPDMPGGFIAAILSAAAAPLSASFVKVPNFPVRSI